MIIYYHFIWFGFTDYGNHSEVKFAESNCFLHHRMAQYLLGEDSDDTIPYCVAAGNAAMLVQFFTQRGQLSDALIAAAAAYEGNINPPTKAKHRSKSQSNGITEDENNIRYVKHRCPEQGVLHCVGV